MDDLDVGFDYEGMKKILERIDENGGVIAPPSYFTQVPDMFVRRTDLTINEKMVFIYIWGYAADKGHAFPSQSRMLKELGITKPTLNKVLNALEEKNALYVVNQFKKSTGQQVANLYFMAQVNMQTGEFDSTYIEMNKIMYPEKKRILEKL